ncbi:helix-hairpin-helix domain-containing protein, partial [bacterium]|nr:helix-hairpin-helix domain-containing protein [bacterium]
EEDRPGILQGLSGKVSAALVEAGFDSAQSIAAASDKDLLKVPGLGPKTVEKLRNMAISMEESGEE